MSDLMLRSALLIIRYVAWGEFLVLSEIKIKMFFICNIQYNIYLTLLFYYKAVKIN